MAKRCELEAPGHFSAGNHADNLARLKFDLVLLRTLAIGTFQKPPANQRGEPVGDGTWGYNRLLVKSKDGIELPEERMSEISLNVNCMPIQESLMIDGTHGKAAQIYLWYSLQAQLGWNRRQISTTRTITTKIGEMLRQSGVRVRNRRPSETRADVAKEPAPVAAGAATPVLCQGLACVLGMFTRSKLIRVPRKSRCHGRCRLSSPEPQQGVWRAPGSIKPHKATMG